MMLNATKFILQSLTSKFAREHIGKFQTSCENDYLYLFPFPDNMIYGQNTGKFLNQSLRRDLCTRIIVMQPKLYCGWIEADSKNTPVTQNVS